MCGRYVDHVKKMRAWVDVLKDWPSDVKASYNVAPTQTVPIFTPDGGIGAKWSLIPAWSKDLNPKYSTFNARLEGIESKPAFRNAWKQSQRCLIPAMGYYEWKGEKGNKQPYFVYSVDGEPVVFAGLYEPARDDKPASCTIITKAATGKMAELHSRVPVFVSLQEVGDWYTLPPASALELVSSESSVMTDYYPVSKAVGNSRNDDPRLIDRVELN